MELSYRQAHRFKGALVYAFPLDAEGVLHCGKKISPISPDIPDNSKEYEFALGAQIDKVFHHIIKRCYPLWPGKVKIQHGYSQGQHYTLLALVAATGRNDQIIPQGETLQKLKEIMTDDGFKEPRWFVLTT